MFIRMTPESGRQQPGLAWRMTMADCGLTSVDSNLGREPELRTSKQTKLFLVCVATL